MTDVGLQLVGVRRDTLRQLVGGQRLLVEPGVLIRLGTPGSERDPQIGVLSRREVLYLLLGSHVQFELPGLQVVLTLVDAPEGLSEAAIQLGLPFDAERVVMAEPQKVRRLNRESREVWGALERMVQHVHTGDRAAARAVHEEFGASPREQIELLEQLERCVERQGLIPAEDMELRPIAQEVDDTLQLLNALDAPAANSPTPAPWLWLAVILVPAIPLGLTILAIWLS